MLKIKSVKITINIVLVFYLVWFTGLDNIIIRSSALNVENKIQTFDLSYDFRYSHNYDYFNTDYSENFKLNITVNFNPSTDQKSGSIKYYLNKNITYSELVSLLTQYITGAPREYITKHQQGEYYNTYFFNRTESQEDRILGNSTYVNFWISNSILNVGYEEKFFLIEYPVSIPVVGIPKLMKIGKEWYSWNFFTPNIESIITSFHLFIQTSTTNYNLVLNNFYEIHTKILVLSEIDLKITHPVGEEIQTFKISLSNHTADLFPSYSFDNIFLLYSLIITIVSGIVVISIILIRFVYIKLKAKYGKGEYVRIKL